VAHVLVGVFEKDIIESFESWVRVFLNESDFELPSVSVSVRVVCCMCFSVVHVSLSPCSVKLKI